MKMVPLFRDRGGILYTYCSSSYTFFSKEISSVGEARCSSALIVSRNLTEQGHSSAPPLCHGRTLK